MDLGAIWYYSRYSPVMPWVTNFCLGLLHDNRHNFNEYTRSSVLLWIYLFLVKLSSKLRSWSSVNAVLAFLFLVDLPPLETKSWFPSSVFISSRKKFLSSKTFAFFSLFSDSSLADNCGKHPSIPGHSAIWDTESLHSTWIYVSTLLGDALTKLRVHQLYAHVSKWFMR